MLVSGRSRGRLWGARQLLQGRRLLTVAGVAIAAVVLVLGRGIARADGPPPPPGAPDACFAEGPTYTVAPTLSPTGSGPSQQTLTLTEGTWVTFSGECGTRVAGVQYAFYRDGTTVVKSGSFSGSSGGSATYATVSGDEGHVLTAQVTACDNLNYCTPVSPTGSYTPVWPSNTVKPTVTPSGTGQTVGTVFNTTASHGTWSSFSAITAYGYQWLRNGTLISGATNSSYTSVAADAGTTLTLQVRADNAHGWSPWVTSSNNAQLVPFNTAAPTISPSGTNRTVGETLTTTNGTWQDAISHTYSYAWLRNGTPIGGATSSSYTTGAADAGLCITSKVTATNSYGPSPKTSSNSACYVNHNPAAPTNLSPGDGRIANNDTPTLSSTYSDQDGQSGHVTYTITKLDGTAVTSGQSATVSSGATATWTVPAGQLHPGTSYKWYAQAVDSLSATSAQVGPLQYTDQYRLGAAREYTFWVQPIDDQESLGVNVGNGNLLLTAADLDLPGIAGFDLNLPRSYNSLYSSAQDLAGSQPVIGWQTVASLGIFANGDTRYTAASGAEYTFTKNTDGSYSIPPGVDAQLVKNPNGSYTLTFDQSGEKLNFDSTGLLQTDVDKSGNTITFNRSGGRLQSITDSYGHTTAFTYNGSGQLTTISAPGNCSGGSCTYSYGYDASGNLASFTDPTGKTRTYAYNAASLLTQVTDSLGHMTKVGYDTSNRVSSIQTGLDSAGNCPSGSSCPTTSFSYGVTGGTFCSAPTTDVTDANAGLTRYCFDSRLRVTAVQAPDGSITSTDYTSVHGGSGCTDANGNSLDNLPCSTTDALGNTTTYSYSSTYSEDVLSATGPDPDGAGPLLAPVTTHTYDEANHPYLPTQVTDPNGKVTTYTYDVAGNTIKTVVDGVTVSQFTFSLPGQTCSSVGYGQVCSSADAEGKWTSFTYDANGNLASSTDPAGDKTTYTLYDSAGRVLTEVAPRGNVTGGNPADYTTTYSYDHDGRLLSVTDPLGYITSYTYDGAGNKTSVIDGNGHTTTYAYDANNRLTSVTSPDPDGAGPLSAPVTSYTYDTNGNKLSETDPDGNTTTNAYDPNNRLISVTTQSGNKTTYSYDDNGNLTGTVDPRGNVQGGNPSDYTTTKAYDQDGRLSSVTDPLGHQTRYAHDASGNQTSVTDANNHTTSYTYDAQGRVLTVTAPDSGVTTSTYDGDGHVLTRTDANGHTTIYAYDDAGRLISLTGPDPTATARSTRRSRPTATTPMATRSEWSSRTARRSATATTTTTS